MLLNNCSEHTNLSALIASKKYDDLTEEEKVNMSFSNQKMPEDGKFDEDMPYLDIYISDSLLEVENHLNHTLFSTDPKKMTTDDYFVKSHAQVIREYEEKRRHNNTEKLPEKE